MGVSMAMMMCTDDEYDHAGCACGVGSGGDDDVHDSEW